MDGQDQDVTPHNDSNSEIRNELDVELQDNGPVATKNRRGIPFFGVSVILLMVLLALMATVWLAAREAKKMPPSYQAVLHMDPQDAAIQGSKLEHNLVRLQNAAQSQQPWKVELTQEQINGWLVSDLPEKFPGSLPEQIRDPRVRIEEDELKFIFKFATEQLEGFVVVQTDIFCTDIENQAAIKITDVRSGFVPLPIGPWVKRVTDVFQKIGVPVTWASEDQDPVAIFTIPEFLSAKGVSQNAAIDTIQLQNGKLVVAGQTRQLVEKVARSKDNADGH